jgi:N-acetylmuramoyl-L-alanine amidase
MLRNYTTHFLRTVIIPPSAVIGCIGVFLVVAALLVGGGAVAETPKKDAAKKDAPKQDSGSLSSAVERYKKVKKDDPSVKDLAKWEEAAAPLQEFADRSDSPKDRAIALFLLGRLHEAMFRERRSQVGLSQATFYFERVAAVFSESELADDALLALGDLRRDGLGDENGAKAAYREILEKHPAGDKVASAKQKLGLQAGAIDSKKGAPSPLPQQDAVAAKAAELKSSINPGEGKQVLSKEMPVRRPLIVIDAGHGGEDLGAVGVDDVREKEVVLNIAGYLDQLLRERLRARTILTRTRDVFIPLPERTKIANENRADLFISIHANASEFKTASGVETYYLDNTNDKASLKLADRENLSLQFGGDSNKSANDLGFIMGDLIQNVKLDDSITLAHKLQNSVVDTLGRYYKGVNNLGVKKAPFFVLVGAHMPCVLVEVSFIDHPMEGKRLSDRKYQKLVAQSLYQGVRNYFVPR